MYAYRNPLKKTYDGKQDTHTPTYFSNKKWIIYPPNASKGTRRIVSSFLAMTTFSTLLCVKNLKESPGRHWKFESVRGNCPMAVVQTDGGSLSRRRNGNPESPCSRSLRRYFFLADFFDAHRWGPGFIGLNGGIIYFSSVNISSFTPSKSTWNCLELFTAKHTGRTYNKRTKSCDRTTNWNFYDWNLLQKTFLLGNFEENNLTWINNILLFSLNYFMKFIG